MGIDCLYSEIGGNTFEMHKTQNVLENGVITCIFLHVLGESGSTDLMKILSQRDLMNMRTKLYNLIQDIGKNSELEENLFKKY